MNLTPPEQYMFCSNSLCKNAETCLRSLCYKQLTKDDVKISVLNPILFPKQDEECPYFRTNKKITLAWGIEKIFDEIPSKPAAEIKKELLSRYGKTKYYRFYREEKPLFLADQKRFERVFKEHGIETPIKYDHYTEDYDWTY